MLERAEDAAARGAPVRALLAGAGTATDARHAVAPRSDGRCLQAAVEQAVARAGAVPAEVDHVNAHGTGTPQGDRVEAAVLGRLFGPGRPPVTSAKGVTGHTMGAAGAIEAALTVLTVQRRTIPPTANYRTPEPGGPALDVVAGAPRPRRIRLALSVSAGFGGHNTVLAFVPAAAGRW